MQLKSFQASIYRLVGNKKIYSVVMVASELESIFFADALYLFTRTLHSVIGCDSASV